MYESSELRHPFIPNLLPHSLSAAPGPCWSILVSSCLRAGTTVFLEPPSAPFGSPGNPRERKGIHHSPQRIPTGTFSFEAQHSTVPFSEIPDLAGWVLCKHSHQGGASCRSSSHGCTTAAGASWASQGGPTSFSPLSTRGSPLWGTRAKTLRQLYMGGIPFQPTDRGKWSLGFFSRKMCQFRKVLLIIQQRKLIWPLKAGFNQTENATHLNRAIFFSKDSFSRWNSVMYFCCGDQRVTLSQLAINWKTKQSCYNWRSIAVQKAIKSEARK